MTTAGRRPTSAGRRPTSAELIEAVAEFLETEIREATTGSVNFHARVAANALRIVERELRDTAKQSDRLRGARTESTTPRRGEAMPLEGRDDMSLVTEIVPRVTEEIAGKDSEDEYGEVKVYKDPMIEHADRIIDHTPDVYRSYVNQFGLDQLWTPPPKLPLRINASMFPTYNRGLAYEQPAAR